MEEPELEIVCYVVSGRLGEHKEATAGIPQTERRACDVGATINVGKITGC